MPGPIKNAVLKAQYRKAQIEKARARVARPANQRKPAEQASHFSAQCGQLGPFLSSAAVESSRGFMVGAYAT